MRSDNVALLERGYQAFTSGDLDTVRGMSAEDCVWHTPGFGGMQADYEGPDGVVSYLTTLFEQTDGTFKDEPEAFVADDEDHVVVLEHVTASRGGKALDTHVMHVFEVHDGKVQQATEYASDPAKLQEFWA